MGSQAQLLTDEQAVKDEDSLPLWRKLCFAVGGVPFQTTSAITGFFLNLFLLEVVLLEPHNVSIIFLFGKLCDAIIDPRIGILVQKTNTRWGKMRPWILFSSPFACACYFLLFYVPWGVSRDATGKEHIDASEGSKLGFYFAMFCLFQGFLTCLHVPYTSLTMFITTKQKDRDLLTVMRMGFASCGVLIAVIVQGLFVSSARCKGDEVDKNSTSIELQKQAYVHGSLFVISIYIVCCLTVFFGTKEKKGIFTEKAQNQVGFFQGVKLVFTYKPNVWASLTFVLWTYGNQVAMGNTALFCTHVLKRGDDISQFMLTQIIVSMASMPIWHFIAQRYGKKHVYAAGIMMTIPVFVSHFFIPGDTPIWVYYIITAVSGFGISVALFLPWSLLPDILDLYTIEKKSRHDALFYSFYIFFNKLTGGVGSAVSQIALEFGGYASGECKQPESVELTLRLLMAPGPTILALISLVTLYMYPINESKRKWIRETMTSMSIEVEKVSVTARTNGYDSIKTENVTPLSHL